VARRYRQMKLAAPLVLTWWLLPASVGRAAWSAPQRLSNQSSLEFGAPQVAIDASGDAIAVWNRGRYAHRVIEASTRRAGGQWSAPTRLDAGAPSASTDTVAIDSHGEATVVWVRETVVRKHVYTQVKARSADASGRRGRIATLASSLAPSQEAERRLTVPHIAVSADGTLVVAYNIKRDAHHEYIDVSRRGRNLRWRAPRAVARAASTTETQVATDARGETILAWETGAPEYEGGEVNVLFLDRRGVPESGPRVVSLPGETSIGIALAVDPNGDAVVSWGDTLPDGEGEGRIEVATRIAGRGFTKPVRIVRKAWPAQAAITPQGEAVLLFLTETSTGLLSEPIETVEAATHPLHGAWSKPLRLSPREGATPQLASNMRGDLIAVWPALAPKSTRESPSYELEAAFRPTVQSWRALPLIPVGHLATEEPSVAVDESGDAVLLWRNEILYAKPTTRWVGVATYTP
jgi:hypothetical protein